MPQYKSICLLYGEVKVPGRISANRKKLILTDDEMLKYIVKVGE